MKLVCEIEVSNRCWTCLGDRKTKTTFKRSVITIGHKITSNAARVEDERELLLFLVTCQNNAGTKYKIKGNVENVFCKFAAEGKSTIRFKEPPHDLIIKNADPVQLKGLLSVFSLACKGQVVKKTLLSQPPLKVEPAKIKLTIKSRKDYPLTSFPSGLKFLTINEIKLLRVSSALSSLANLEYLNLSNNCLENVCQEIFQMKKLRSLIISNNKLTSLQEKQQQDIPFNEAILILDLKNNLLNCLPESLINLRNLRQLNCDSNLLSSLPQCIGQFDNLKVLTASHNRIKVLPSGFLKLRKLDLIDLSSNQFSFLEVGFEIYPKINFEFSLKSLSASTVIKKKLKYSPEDLPLNLISFLRNGKLCLCQKFFCESKIENLSTIILTHFAETVVDNKYAQIEMNCCSENCRTILNRFK